MAFDEPLDVVQVAHDPRTTHKMYCTTVKRTFTKEYQASNRRRNRAALAEVHVCRQFWRISYTVEHRIIVQELICIQLQRLDACRYNRQFSRVTRNNCATQLDSRAAQVLNQEAVKTRYCPRFLRNSRP